MNVDGVIALVAKETKNGVHVFLRGRHWRGADCAGQKDHAVLFGFVFLPIVEPREKLQIDDVLDAFGLEKLVVGIRFRFRTFVNPFIQLLETNEMGTRGGMNSADIGSVCSDRRLCDRTAPDEGQ